jgi:hypothetical protein
MIGLPRAIGVLPVEIPPLIHRASAQADEHGVHHFSTINSLLIHDGMARNQAFDRLIDVLPEVIRERSGGQCSTCSSIRIRFKTAPDPFSSS